MLEQFVKIGKARSKSEVVSGSVKDNKFTRPRSCSAGGGKQSKKNDQAQKTRKTCANCRTSSTPSWRRCPDGKDLLCNACGLYMKLHHKPRPFFVLDDGSIKVQRMTLIDGNVCSQCHTKDTPLWRRGNEGKTLCMSRFIAL